MDLDEGRRHRTKQQLLRSLSHLRHAHTQIIRAEDDTQPISVFNTNTDNVYNNLQLLRIGIKETQTLIAHTIKAIELEMREPNAQSPPTKGAHINQTLTPKQRDMERRLGIRFPSTLPLTFNPPKPIKISEVIPHTPYKPKKRKPRTRKKEGIIPI